MVCSKAWLLKIGTEKSARNQKVKYDFLRLNYSKSIKALLVSK